MAVPKLQQVRVLDCVTLLLICIQISTQSCPDDDLYVIRNGAPNGLVLDGTDPEQVTVEHYTGWSPQLWKFERSMKNGNWIYIINNYTGLPLDFVKRDDGYLHLVTSEGKDKLEQRWNLTKKGRITNAENGKNIDVADGNFTAGNELILYEDNDTLAQKFVFRRKIRRNVK